MLFSEEQVSMSRENNLKEFKTAYNIDSMPTTGEGSEFGREARDEARRRKYGYIRKKYNPEAQPWQMQISAEKNAKKYAIHSMERFVCVIVSGVYR